MENEEHIKELVKKLDKEYPFIPYVSVSMLWSTVRRMKKEKELNIPIVYRKGVAISVETGKYANEMKEQEWEKFYQDLSGQLKRDYPSLYKSLFSQKNDI